METIQLLLTLWVFGIAAPLAAVVLGALWKLFH